MRWPAFLERFRPVDYDEPVSVLDLETSGLDPKSDRILSIAAVRVEGGRIVLSERFHRLVQDAGPVNREAIRHHRLRPVDVRHGEPLGDVLEAFVAWHGGRPLVGYAVAFDLAFLRREARSRRLDLPPRRADVRDRYRDRCLRANPQHPPDLRFEAMARALGVPIIGRHDALGDAVSTALMWIGLGGRGGAPAKA